MNTHTGAEAPFLLPGVTEIPAIMKAGQVCDLLQISRTTLWFYTSAGVIRPIRVGATGRGVRFAGEEIRRFINEQMGAGR